MGRTRARLSFACVLLALWAAPVAQAEVYRDAYNRCAAFPNDLLFAHGADTGP